MYPNNKDYFGFCLENHSILKKITEITKRANKYSMDIQNVPKYIHGSSRKINKKNLAYENELLLKRIIAQESTLSKKKLSVDYQQVEKVKKIISKRVGYFSLQSKQQSNKGNKVDASKKDYGLVGSKSEKKITQKDCKEGTEEQFSILSQEPESIGDHILPEDCY